MTRQEAIDALCGILTDADQALEENYDETIKILIAIGIQEHELPTWIDSQQPTKEEPEPLPPPVNYLVYTQEGKEVTKAFSAHIPKRTMQEYAAEYTKQRLANQSPTNQQHPQAPDQSTTPAD